MADGIEGPNGKRRVAFPKSRLRRALGAAAIAIAALVLPSGAWLYRLSHGGLGPDSGTVRISGLSAPVKVIRDVSGIPHIFAQNRLDLARALGYVEAQDRLFQTEMRGRLAEGKLAEVFGPDLVESDYLFRLFDPERFARESLAMYPPGMRAELDAYAEGRNAWIDQHRDDLPLAFRLLGIKPRRATALDLEAGALPIALLLAYNLTEEGLYLNLAPRIDPEMIAELMPVYPGAPLEPPPPAITAALSDATKLSFHPAPEFARLARLGIAASNNWVVDGSKSMSGKPMLANDPHLPQSIPSIWYEAVLVTPDGFTTGAMAAGALTISIGTNGRVAWGVTSVQADVTDLSIEKLSPDGNSYLYRGKWYPLDRREVTIKVRGAPDVHRVISSTLHGPLVSEVLSVADNPLSGVAVRGNYALALRFAGLTPAPVERPGIEAAQARDGRELVEAFRHFAITPLNLVWADADGNIGWHVVGAIPNRTGFDGKYPTPGWTGEFEWNGTIPYDQLPHSENPPSHSIVTANERRGDVPYNGSWCPPWRHDRIAALIEQHPRLALDDFKAIQLDHVSLFALRMRDVLLEAGDGGDPDLGWALSELRAFDGAMIGRSRAAAIIGVTQVTLAARLFRDRLGPDFNPFVKLEDDGGYDAVEDVLNRPDSRLWPSNGRDATVRASLQDALALLRTKLGDDREKWSWGALHTITFKHPLGERGGIAGWYFNRGPFPSAGGRHTVNNGWFNLGDPYQTEQISSYRFIVDMGDAEHVLAMNHSGESDNPASAHYEDMIEPWRGGQYHVLSPSLPEAQASATAEIELIPADTR